MARTHFVPTQLKYQYCEAYGPDFVQSCSTPQPSDTAYKLISRPDVIKNVKDIAGWRPPTPYFCEAVDKSPIQGSIQYYIYNNGVPGVYRMETYNGGLFQLYGDCLPGIGGPDFAFQNANSRNRAEVECLLKVRDQSINLLNTFAERQKTIEMITERTTRVYRAYAAAKKGNFRAAAKALGVDKRGKTNAKSWLELQYGWLPLLSDIHGGYEFMTGRRAKKGLLFKVSRTITDSDSRVDTDGTSAWTKVSNVNVKKTTKVVLWYTVQYEALAEAEKLGLLNPLEVAWELTPWSFVIDWFLPVGNLLGALSATNGCTFKGGTCTTTVRTNIKVQVIPKNGTGFGTTIKRSGNAEASMDYFKMDRSVYSGTPIPTPYVKNPFSVKHALNALALLRGIIK